MTYRPGESGNPAGRPKGARNKRQSLMSALKDVFGTDGEAAFWRMVVERAKAGDPQAIALIAKRIMPELRPQAAPVDITLPEELDQAAAEILKQTAAGDVTADAAKDLLAGLLSVTRIHEAVDIEARIAALEARHDG